MYRRHEGVTVMGNKFGNFANEQAAIDAIVAEGFALSINGNYAKKSHTGGNLIEAPRRCVALVEISSYRVDGQYAADGKDYHVFQHHFL